MPRPPSDAEVRRRYGLAPDAAVRRARSVDGRATVRPDSFAVVELESALEWAAWDRPVVVAGSAVRLSVRGRFVGEGSPVRVTLRDARNRAVGRGEGPMHRDRAVVEVTVDRRTAERDPDGVLCAADVELPELGLKAVSAPLLVLPYAALEDARWSEPEARAGDVVTLSCRLTGSPAGVERVGREPVDVEILRGDEGEGALSEPVMTLRATADRGRVEVSWRVGYEPDGKARIATQADHDAAAARTGAEAERYARPAWRFRARVAGLKAESDEMGYRDHVDLAWGAGTERPAAGAPVEVRYADGTAEEVALGDDGRLHLADVPPGPVEALFGPDPRVWSPPADLAPGPAGALAPPEPLPDPARLVVPPPEPVLIAAADLDPRILADLAGFGPDDDDDSFIDWLWSTMAGDFNEDASYDQIVANIGASFVPVVGQVMDVRDVFAGLYLLWKDEGYRDWLKWLALFATLVGIIPVLGDALKGLFRIALRSIRHGADDAAGAAAAAVEAAFRKTKEALDKAGIDVLDGVESAAHWVRDLDIAWIVNWARGGIEWVGGRAVEVFRWAAESAESGVLRVGEAWRAGLSGVGLLAGRAFDIVRRRPPRAAAPSATLGARLRAVVVSVETIQARANAQVGSGLRTLDNKLREIVGLPPRPRGSGLSGGEVRPDGAGPGPPRPPGLEDGAVRREYRANGLNEVARRQAGWPDLPAGDAATFVRAVPVELPPGTRIYRVIEDGRYPDGSFWAYELPGSRAEWRNRFAVKDEWSQNGYYVDYIVPDHRTVPGAEPFRVWSGPAAEQAAKVEGWTLPGGGEQIWMPRGHVVPNPQRSTGW